MEKNFAVPFFGWNLFLQIVKTPQKLEAAKI